MKKLVWLAIGFAIGCFAWRQHQLGDWPFSAGKASADASLPAPSNAPDAKAVAPDANSTRASRSHGSPGEWGGVADPQGILDRSQVTPHLDGAADKARQATCCSQVA